jgi:hypothetical protein
VALILLLSAVVLIVAALAVGGVAVIGAADSCAPGENEYRRIIESRAARRQT